MNDVQAEERVRELLVRENKPFNVQTITDHLAQFGVKKPQVHRAVDALSAEDGGIICKVTRSLSSSQHAIRHKSWRCSILAIAGVREDKDLLRLASRRTDDVC